MKNGAVNRHLYTVIALIIILSLLFLFLLSLLVVKMKFIVDTDESVFVFRQGVMYKIQALYDPENPALVRIHIFGIPFTLNVTKLGKGRKKKKPKRKKRRRSSISGWKAVRTILGTFHVKKLHVSFDSNDMTLNSQLYPIVFGLNQSLDDRYWLEVNFYGENYLKTIIENRPIRIVRAFIKLRSNQSKSNQHGV